MYTHEERAWLRAMELPAKPVTVSLSGQPQQLYSGRAVLAGWALITTGGPGTVTIRDGLDSTGQIVAQLGGAAAASFGAGPATKGIRCDLGLWITMGSFTTVTGVLWFREVSLAGFEHPFGPGNEPAAESGHVQGSPALRSDHPGWHG